MTIDAIERLRYYQHQYLGALDFEDEQDYHRDMRRRHNLGLHTWGIVVGLELEERPPVSGGIGPIEIFIRPGMAIDGFGRELVVLEPFQIEPDPQLFQGLTTSGYVPVWVTYAEDRVRRPAPGWEQCTEDEQFGRVRERFRVLVGAQTQHPDIVVAGQTVTSSSSVQIPPDDAVPHQELPTDEDGVARWLVRLGSVNWDGRPGQRKFLANDPPHLSEERRYVASIAAEVLAPAETIRIRKRWTPTDPTKETDDFAAVEDSLRVDGLLTARDSIRLWGGAIDFRDAGGSPKPTLEVWRNDPTGLRIRLGDDAAGDTKLEVGINDPSTFEAKFTVNDKGEVDTKGRVDVFGAVLLNERLEIRDASGGIDTDPLRIERFQRGTDENDLRIVIGDNPTTLKDRLVVGPVPGGAFAEKVSIDSAGVTRIAGDTTIGAAGDAVLHTRHIWGKLNTNDNNDVLYLQYGNGLDVQVGGGTPTSAPRSALHVAGDATVGYGGNGRLRLRHIDGKDWQSDALDHLYLQWRTNMGVVIGDVGFPSPLTVNGDLRVTGVTNAVIVRTFDLSKTNGANNSERSWNVSHAGVFAAVYAKFVVMRGFSMWPHQNNLTWAPGFHDPNNSVQHAYVRVNDDTNTATTTGVCYASENDGSVESDNSVLFTVVVIGRGV